MNRRIGERHDRGPTEPCARRRRRHATEPTANGAQEQAADPGVGADVDGWDPTDRESDHQRQRQQRCDDAADRPIAVHCAWRITRRYRPTT